MFCRFFLCKNSEGGHQEEKNEKHRVNHLSMFSLFHFMQSMSEAIAFSLAVISTLSKSTFLTPPPKISTRTEIASPGNSCLLDQRWRCDCHSRAATKRKARSSVSATAGLRAANASYDISKRCLSTLSKARRFYDVSGTCVESVSTL